MTSTREPPIDLAAIVRRDGGLATGIAGCEPGVGARLSSLSIVSELCRS
jgi:hypothetical protein